MSADTQTPAAEQPPTPPQALTLDLAGHRAAALARLREPFDEKNIGKLPRISCYRCSNSPEKVCAEHRKQRCAGCRNYITSGHIHLDYVGHAETTDRLLSVDPEWTWEPLAFTADGLPAFDDLGGLWMRLTVCGVTRLGYGSANGKKGPDAVKEVIGDGIRNASMRFGVALNLWAKTELHDNHPHTEDVADAPQAAKPPRQSRTRRGDQGGVAAAHDTGGPAQFARRSKGQQPTDQWSTPEPADGESLLTSFRRSIGETNDLGELEFLGKAVSDAVDAGELTPIERDKLRELALARHAELTAEASQEPPR